MSLHQSEHIGQRATPHDRRLGGIGRVVPIVATSISRMGHKDLPLLRV